MAGRRDWRSDLSIKHPSRGELWGNYMSQQTWPGQLGHHTWLDLEMVEGEAEAGIWVGGLGRWRRQSPSPLPSLLLINASENGRVVVVDTWSLVRNFCPMIIMETQLHSPVYRILSSHLQVTHSTFKIQTWTRGGGGEGS